MRCPGNVSCLTSLPVRRRLWGRSTTIDRLASGTAGMPVEGIMEVRGNAGLDTVRLPPI